METLTTAEGASYVPLHLDTSILTRPLKCDLHIIEKGKFVLYREACLPFEEPDQSRLLASGVDRLWIRVSKDVAPSVDSLKPSWNSRILTCLAVPRRDSSTDHLWPWRNGR
jgi:hypothetical protein